MKKVLCFILAAALLTSPALAAETAKAIPAMAIEYSEPPMIGTETGPYCFNPTAIVIHNSASFPWGDYDSADMWAGYRRFHMDTVHPGIYPDWIGVYPAQEGYPDGLSYPNQKGTNDIDYHWGIPVGADIATGMGVLAGRDSRTVGWHAGGALPGRPEINTYSWGICFVGNFDERPPDAAQYKLGVDFISQIMVDQKIRFDQLFGHKEVRGTTSCPGAMFPLAQFKEDVRIRIGGFYDVAYDAWYYGAVKSLSASGVITGFANKMLYPEAVMTRAEFVTTIWKASGSPPGTALLFPDVEAESWASRAISWAATKGIVTGYPDGTFQPGKTTTRAEVAAMICRWRGIAPQTPEWEDAGQSWAAEWIGGAALAGYLTGYPDLTFKPENITTRAEIFSIVARILQ